MKLFVFLLVSFAFVADATHKCVWVRGILRCNKDQSKHYNVEVRVYDRDGISILQLIDPDDLMGVTFTEENGSFQLDGCGNDFNFIPGVENLPEPYIQIRHSCNGDKEETIELPIFDTFVPETHDIGILELDTETPKAIDVNKKQEVIVHETEDSGEVVISPHGREFVEQTINPKFSRPEVTLPQDHEEKTDEDNKTKSKVMITHPDDLALED
uniref:Uncharacterized protein n=1 Tax=Panagrolaimus superbus TaxID=310955 RepID=A0A914Z0D7_9BILA